MARLDTYGPAAALLNLERIPVWQAGAVKGVSLFALGTLPKGAVLLNRVGYTADTSATADADPGAGKLRWNNATQASATVVYLNDADSGAGDHSALWATINVGAKLYVANQAMTVRQVWQVTAVTDAAGYVKLAVILVASNGSFASAAAMQVSLQQPDPAPGLSIQTVTSAGTVTPVATNDKVVISAQAAALTLANPSGTAAEGLGFVIALKDNGTARAITFDTAYRAMGAALPTTTTAGKWIYIPVQYNATDAKWDVFPAVVQQ